MLLLLLKIVLCFRYWRQQCLAFAVSEEVVMLFQLWNAFAFMECFCNYGMLLHLWNAFAYNVDVVLLLPLEHAFAVDEGGVTLLPRLFLYLSLFFFLIINVLFKQINFSYFYFYLLVLNIMNKTIFSSAKDSEKTFSRLKFFVITIF